MNNLRKFIVKKLEGGPLHAKEISHEISGVFGIVHDNRQIRGIINGTENKKGINYELLDRRTHHYIISGNYGYKLVDLLDVKNSKEIEKFEAKELASGFSQIMKVYMLRRERGKLTNISMDEFIASELEQHKEVAHENSTFI